MFFPPYSSTYRHPVSLPPYHCRQHSMGRFRRDSIVGSGGNGEPPPSMAEHVQYRPFFVPSGTMDGCRCLLSRQRPAPPCLMTGDAAVSVLRRWYYRHRRSPSRESSQNQGRWWNNDGGRGIRHCDSSSLDGGERGSGGGWSVMKQSRMSWCGVRQMILIHRQKWRNKYLSSHFKRRYFVYLISRKLQYTYSPTHIIHVHTYCLIYWVWETHHLEGV